MPVRAPSVHPSVACVGYHVHRQAVPRDLVTAAVRRLNLEIVRRGLTVDEIAEGMRGTFFPHLRWDPEILAIQQQVDGVVRPVDGWVRFDEADEAYLTLRAIAAPADAHLRYAPELDALNRQQADRFCSSAAVFRGLKDDGALEAIGEPQLQAERRLLALILPYAAVTTFVVAGMWLFSRWIVRTLAAPEFFDSHEAIGLLATVVKSEGEMTLVRPDRLRWELKPPDAIIYILAQLAGAVAGALLGLSFLLSGVGNMVGAVEAGGLRVAGAGVLFGTAAALVFPQKFFPESEPFVGTLLAFSTYFVGFVARPAPQALLLSHCPFDCLAHLPPSAQ
mgnify:CR=1 FL=1